MNKFYELITSKLEKRLRIDVKYMLSGSFWMTTRHIFSLIGILTTSYFFSNYLDPEIYGTYKYILTVGLLLSAFSLSGIGTSIIQAAAKSIRGYFSHAQTLSLKYGLIISAFSIAGSCYYTINDNHQLSTGLIIIAVLQPLMNTSTLIFNQFIGEQRFKTDAHASVVKIVITSTSIIATIVLSGQLWTLLIVYFLTNIFSDLLARLLFYRKSETVDKYNRDVKKLTNFAKHISIQAIISKLANHLDKILIFQNLGAYDLAVYTFAVALPDQYKAFTKSIENMILPRFSNYSEKTIKSRMLHKSFIYFLSLLFICTIYIIASPYIFDLLFPTYEESVFLSQIYVLGTLSAIGSLPLQGLKATLAKRRLYVFNASIALFQIVVLLILLPLYGLLGAVMARVLYRTFVAISAYTLYFYKSPKK